MYMYKKYNIVIAFILNLITYSCGQYLIKSFHKSSQDQLESNICSLYTPTQNISSSVQCAKTCADIHCCSSYGYEKSSKMCLFCMYQHANPDYNGLTAYTGVIPTGMNLYEKKKNDLPALNNCAEIYRYGETCSRVYNLKVSGESVDVFCDMHTSGGGWTVFQRRQDGSVSFGRNWINYKQGFGSLTGEFWLGNDILASMTSTCNIRLRVDLESFGRETRYAEYENFWVADESVNYKLTLGAYSGTAGDGGQALAYQNGMKFTTIDRDNDQWGPDNCASLGGGDGGFWYNACERSSPNGVYRDAAVEDVHGIQWKPWLSKISLKRVEMKIRPMNF